MKTEQALTYVRERDRVRLARLEAERAMGWPDPFNWTVRRNTCPGEAAKHRFLQVDDAAARDWAQPRLAFVEPARRAA